MLNLIDKQCTTKSNGLFNVLKSVLVECFKASFNVDIIKYKGMSTPLSLCGQAITFTPRSIFPLCFKISLWGNRSILHAKIKLVVLLVKL